MGRNQPFRLLVWDYLRSPAEIFFCLQGISDWPWIVFCSLCCWYGYYNGIILDYNGEAVSISWGFNGLVFGLGSLSVPFATDHIYHTVLYSIIIYPILILSCPILSYAMLCYAILSYLSIYTYIYILCNPILSSYDPALFSAMCILPRCSMYGIWTNIFNQNHDKLGYSPVN